ncbi:MULTISPECIES: hypothetical protein [unclassified Marinovum]
MTRIIAIVALVLAGAGSTASAQQYDHNDRQPIMNYAPAGTDLSSLSHEEVHMLLTIISSSSHENEVRRAVRGFLNQR